MGRTSSGLDREHTFRSLNEAVYPDLVRFVQRRSHPDLAEDVVAEAFLVVWRRLDDLPCGHDDRRAWVFGIARNILLNNARGEQRRRALGVRLADATTRADSGPEADLVLRRVDLARAWGLLSENRPPRRSLQRPRPRRPPDHPRHGPAADVVTSRRAAQPSSELAAYHPQARPGGGSGRRSDRRHGDAAVPHRRGPGIRHLDARPGRHVGAGTR